MVRGHSRYKLFKICVYLAGADPGVEIAGPYNPYATRRARAYNGGLGVCPQSIHDLCTKFDSFSFSHS